MVERGLGRKRLRGPRHAPRVNLPLVIVARVRARTGGEVAPQERQVTLKHGRTQRAGRLDRRQVPARPARDQGADGPVAPRLARLHEWAGVEIVDQVGVGLGGEEELDDVQVVLGMVREEREEGEGF